MKILNRDFFLQKTLIVAKELLGKTIVHHINNKKLTGIITETEAYFGFDDDACHAHKKMTPRNKIMFEKGGFSYIYLIYGMYYCFNITTENKHFPSAVLIRAIKTNDIDYKKTNGPGKLCKYLQLTKQQNNIDLTTNPDFYIINTPSPKAKIIQTPRIGINYAKTHKDVPWRFVLNI